MSEPPRTPPSGLAPADDAHIERVAAALASARSALFITGAGISAESGLPTYRGIGGLYDSDETEDGVPIEVALSGVMMEMRPALCWKYIAQIEAACRGARFNRAHTAIAALQRRLDRGWVLTQNVDGFHGDAGSTDLIEIHGNLRRLHCTRCVHEEVVADYAGLALPPSCPDCGAVVRPAVVLFGEMLPGAQVAALRAQLSRGFDVVLSIGTTSVFPYIAQPVLDARRAGALTVEINPGDSEVSDVVSVRLQTGAAAALEAIWTRYAALTGARQELS